MSEAQQQQRPGHYDKPVTIRWQEKRFGEWRVYTSTDSALLEKVYAPLYVKYVNMEIAGLEVFSE